MAESLFTVCGIAGSLRQGSYNRALLRAAVELAPAGMRIDTFERLAELPHYNADVEAAGTPEPVQALREAINRADALLLASPEYNYSIPGVLKNALDWASRPPQTSVLRHKPVAIMGASSGHFGTARGQMALRQVFVFTESHCLLRPEVLVFNAAERFDEQGRLTDQATRRIIAELLQALMDWARLLQPQREPVLAGVA